MKNQFRVWSWVVVLLMTVLSMSASAQKRQPDIRFVPTPQESVEAMLETARVSKNDIVYDLGCGDGRFVITAAQKYGARGVGVDIDPERIQESNHNARAQGVMDRVKFIEADLFETDIREATVVTLYLFWDINVKLRPKLFSELKPGSRVVSYYFDMEDWRPDKKGENFYFWVIPAKVAGQWQWSFIGTDGEKQYQLRLEQKYQEIDGTVNLSDKQVRLQNPRLEGDQLSFQAISESQGSSVTLRFKGCVAGETITGTVEIDGGSLKGTWSWKAHRL